MPKALYQFLNPIAWHKKAQTVKSFRHYDFGVVYDDTPIQFLSDEIKSKKLTVVFLQTRSEAYWNIIRENSDKCLVLSKDAEIAADFRANPDLNRIFCADHSEFFVKLTPIVAEFCKFKLDEVEQSLQKRVDQLKNTLEKIDDNADVAFRACAPNTSTFLQLLAPSGEDALKHAEIEHSNRPAALIKSAERVLRAYSIAVSRNPEADQSWPDLLPPLILTWPYYGPNHKALFKTLIQSQDGRMRDALKVIQRVVFEEQKTDSYDFDIDSALLKDQEAVSVAIMEFKVNMMDYLDNLGFLHASFQDSPYVRMPLTGKSVNEPLSSFQKSCIGANASPKRAGLRLQKVGEALGSRFPAGMLNHIDRYYDQLVAITDIPIEWTICDGVPLAFLVDVCRIPQSDPSSIMAQFAANAATGYSIKPNILEKTLVICGVDSNDLIGKVFDTFAADLRDGDAVGPTAIRCLTKADFIAAIEHYKPDLLIVDSHGNFKTNEEGSYISVGNEKIVGDDIPTIKHATPLVILSCCLTAPLYGCPNTIAQAFFEAHTLSVVSTFLPISVDRGYLLYQRILKNLNAATKQCFHRNWLSFISHNLRTSHFDDYLFPLRDALGEMEDMQLFLKSRTPWMVDSMHPAKRRQSYHATKDAVLNSFRPELRAKVVKALKSRHIIPEAFYYTHLGRADLIQFDVWLENNVSKDAKAKALYEEIATQGCL